MMSFALISLVVFDSRKSFRELNRISHRSSTFRWESSQSSGFTWIRATFPINVRLRRSGSTALDISICCAITIDAISHVHSKRATLDFPSGKSGCCGFPSLVTFNQKSRALQIMENAESQRVCDARVCAGLSAQGRLGLFYAAQLLLHLKSDQIALFAIALHTIGRDDEAARTREEKFRLIGVND